MLTVGVASELLISSKLLASPELLSPCGMKNGGR